MITITNFHKKPPFQLLSKKRSIYIQNVGDNRTARFAIG